MDVPDILLVVQWRVSSHVAALWQRFGHAVRDKGLVGTALLFAEKEYFDDEKAKAARKARRAEIRKQSAEEEDSSDNDGSSEEESDDEETNSMPATSTPGATLLLEALAKWAGS
jgi:superfamily II DNA/RNA helicase